MAKSLASVMGHPAIVVTFEDYSDTMKLMKHGPPYAKPVVKMEVDDAEDVGQPGTHRSTGCSG